MEIGWRFEPAPYLATVAGSALVAVGAGIAASGRALRRRPVEVLRGE
jgi:ABC-type antimicrobial peptide transport system permease subunit